MAMPRYDEDEWTYVITRDGRVVELRFDELAAGGRGKWGVGAWRLPVGELAKSSGQCAGSGGDRYNQSASSRLRARNGGRSMAT